jgi:hypothetical protein
MAMFGGWFAYVYGLNHDFSILSDFFCRKVKLKRKSKWRLQKYLAKAWVGLLLDESSKQTKMVWTDRSKFKYRPTIDGALGRSMSNGLADFHNWISGKKGSKKKPTTKIETAILYRKYRYFVRVRPVASTKKMPYICKAEASCK